MYKCKCCRTQRNIGDDVYLIESATSKLLIPTCSLECAEKIRQEQIEIAVEKLTEIKNSGLKKEKW